MGGNPFLAYILPIIICIGLLLWTRLFCDRVDVKFPTRGSVVLLSIVAFIPIINWFEAVLLIVFYFVGRVTGGITFKKNKFNEYWNN
jgi:hypothetical protein